TYHLEVHGPDQSIKKYPTPINVIQSGTQTSPTVTITTTATAPSDAQSARLGIVTAVLGTLLGILTILTLILLYLLYRQRKANRAAFNGEKTVVSSHWSSSQHYDFAKGKEEDVASQADISDLTPSDSVSQLGRKDKGNLYDQHRPQPLRPFSELSVITEMPGA
ncbi:hypothetical protein MPER_09556, partial [Moniliophthora perniciosa FA553]